MLAGNIFASSASERWYSASITDSARSVSRNANQTVTTIIAHAEAVVMMKLVVMAQGASSPVERGTRNCSVITSATPIVASSAARPMRSIPSCNTTRLAVVTR